MAQCDFVGTISVSTSGFEAAVDYSQRYVLVLDATDEIVAINSSGTFSNLEGAEYRVYAVNYRDAQPGVLAVGTSWATITAYDADTDNCFDASAAYSGGSVTVCEEICDGTDIAVSTSGHHTGGGYTQTFVLVSAAGTILASNTTGTFTSAAYSSTGEYHVYAVNSDEASVAAEIADLGAWSDVSAMASPATCTDILGPRIFGVQACCNAPTVTFSTVPDCASNQFGITVDVTDLGDAAAVNIKQGGINLQTSVGTGSYSVGANASGAEIVLVVEDAADATCSVTSDTLTFTCLSLPVCDNASGSADLIDVNFSTAPAGWTMGSWSNGTSGGLPSGNGNYYYINDDAVNGTHTPSMMYSPTVDASSADTLTLEFDYTFRQFSSSRDDYFSAEVYDGAAWQQVFYIGGAADNDNQSWTTQHIDVSTHANASFQVRFSYHDDGGWCYWAGVDNVKVHAVSTSSDPDVTLPTATGTLTAYPQCMLGDWTYYAVDTNAQYVFAINWQADGSLSNSNRNARDASEVTLALDANWHSVSDLTANAEMATYTMKRYWNVNFSSGGTTMDEAVNVRFFYDPAEKSAIETQSATFASTYTDAVDEGFAWFKTTSGDFDPSVHVSAMQVSGVVALTNTASGTENGHTYVQFNSLTSFSGGTGATGAGPIVVGGPLPVEMLDVAAKEAGAANLVTWETASEQNTRVHVVERSQNGAEFVALGELEAAGNTTQQHSYHFADDAPTARAYYRIRTIDVDGSESVSKMVFVQRTQPTNTTALEAWPNPTNGAANLRFELASSQPVQLRVTDCTGKVVWYSNYAATAGANQLALELQNQPRGMYFVSLQTETGFIATKKVLKE